MPETLTVPVALDAAHTLSAAPEPASDFVWGAKAIGAEIGRGERDVFYLLERGLIGLGKSAANGARPAANCALILAHTHHRRRRRLRRSRQDPARSGGFIFVHPSRRDAAAFTGNLSEG